MFQDCVFCFDNKRSSFNSICFYYAQGFGSLPFLKLAILITLFKLCVKYVNRRDVKSDQN
jgi:hypothetical protein